jgi:5-(carboxyamino)imidazole ribonucleotide synthase
LADPRVHLHLYGKTEPRPGRKMGHLNVLAPTPEAALEAALAARAALMSPS